MASFYLYKQNQRQCKASIYLFKQDQRQRMVSVYLFKQNQSWRKDSFYLFKQNQRQRKALKKKCNLCVCAQLQLRNENCFILVCFSRSKYWIKLGLTKKREASSSFFLLFPFFFFFFGANGKFSRQRRGDRTIADWMNLIINDSGLFSISTVDCFVFVSFCFLFTGFPGYYISGVERTAWITFCWSRYLNANSNVC